MIGFLAIAAVMGFRDILPTTIQIMMLFGGGVALFYPVLSLADDDHGNIAYLEYPNDVLASQSSGDQE